MKITIEQPKRTMGEEVLTTMISFHTGCVSNKCLINRKSFDNIITDVNIYTLAGIQAKLDHSSRLLKVDNNSDFLEIDHIGPSLNLMTSDFGCKNWTRKLKLT